MDKERYDLAQKVMNDLKDFEEYREPLLKAITCCPGVVQRLIIKAIDIKITELKKEFDSL